MQALLWRDYLCPWCYLGRDRTAVLERLGVEVSPLPYDLHPELPPEGRAVPPDGRLAALLDHIAAECDEVGLPFRRPGRIANSRRALEAAELVRRRHPEAFAPVDDALYRAQWVEDTDLGDPAVVDAVLAAAGVDPGPVQGALDAGHGHRAVEEARLLAHEQGVAGTPAWWIDDRLLLPGVQSRDTVERWVTRLIERP